MRVQVLQRMPSAKPGKALLLLAIALSIGGCSGDGDDPMSPAACKEGARALHTALARAPARVEQDGTPLSACLVRGSDPADLQLVGGIWLSAAAFLSDQARFNPNGPEALRLGYLVGAARRGAARTQGVHDELVRRLEQELTSVDTRSPSFQRGLRAGLKHG